MQTTMLVPEEINLIVSSDPASGAFNRSVDGSSFEISLEQGGLRIPSDALNCNLSVEESSIWWTILNILPGVNDKFYITGPSQAQIRSKDLLLYGSTVKFSIANEFLTITSDIGIDPPMPTGNFLVGDVFRVDSGVLATNTYTITAITSDGPFIQSFIITPNNAIQALGVNTFSRIRNANEITNFVLTIPQGLYDLSGLNQTIQRLLADQGALQNPFPLISLSSDDPTQRLEINFNYNTVSVDFTKLDTPRLIMGFDSQIIGPYALSPLTILAPNVAQFNTVNSLLIHSDLTTLGIRFNNSYNQSISQVLINVPPGSQIISKPYNPPKVNIQDLAGSTRSNIRFWLTNEKDERVNTNGEYWTARLAIRYLRPYKL